MLVFIRIYSSFYIYKYINNVQCILIAKGNVFTDLKNATDDSKEHLIKIA